MIYTFALTYEEILPYWKELWKDRVSPIEPMSAMVLPEPPWTMSFTDKYSDPVFLGTYDYSTKKMVAVNSFHLVENTVRSRGLYVIPEKRGHKLGECLLKLTLQMTRDLYPGKVIWSYPKQEALSTYKRAGFIELSSPIFDLIENKTNYYVIA